MTGARIFVAIVFVLLGAAFIASTALLFYEFQRMEWFALVATHSYLFFFFPVLGILALVAFYLPSVIFTDLYWHHLPYGKLRFSVGLVVVAAAAIGFAKFLDKPPRSIWEATPAALTADKGDSASRRVPILQALADVRDKSQSRVGLSSFARPCSPDPLLEIPDEMLK